MIAAVAVHDSSGGSGIVIAVTAVDWGGGHTCSKIIENMLEDPNVFLSGSFLFLGFPWRCIKECSDTARFDSFEPSDVHTALIAVVPVIAVAAVCSSGACSGMAVVWQW